MGSAGAEIPELEVTVMSSAINSLCMPDEAKPMLQANSGIRPASIDGPHETIFKS